MHKTRPFRKEKTHELGSVTLFRGFTEKNNGNLCETILFYLTIKLYMLGTLYDFNYADSKPMGNFFIP